MRADVWRMPVFLGNGAATMKHRSVEKRQFGSALGSAHEDTKSGPRLIPA